MWLPIVRLVRSLRAAYIDLRLFVTGKRDPELPPLRLRFVGPGEFRSAGAHLLELAVSRGALRPDGRVLDIGCGSGRFAIPVSKYLSAAGRYAGFDVVGSAIRWCRRNIGRKRPNFAFTHVALRNSDYRLLGRSAAAFSFPYSGAAFDCVVAFSVFTHLSLSEVENYLREAYRVLSPGGRLLGTFFLLNEESEKALPSRPPLYRFTHREGPAAFSDRSNPSLAVAFDESHLLDLLRRIGFHSEIERGEWCGTAGAPTFQDLVVGRK